MAYLLAQKLGDVSGDQVWRVLRKHKIQLQRRRSWCILTDPEFGPKAADVACRGKMIMSYSGKVEMSY
jgi:hypothetical protein